MSGNLSPPGPKDGEGRANPANVEEVVTTIIYSRKPNAHSPDSPDSAVRTRR